MEKVDRGDFEYNVDYAKGIIIIFSLLVMLCGISAITWQAVSELLAN